MKWNLTTSFCIHCVVVLMAIVTLPKPQTFKPISEIPIEVALISEEEITPKTEIEQITKPVYEPEPKPEPKAIPKPEPEPNPEPVPMPVVEPKPEPKPDVKEKPKPKEEPKEEAKTEKIPPPPIIKPTEKIPKKKEKPLDTIAALLNKIPDEPKVTQNDTNEDPIEALQNDINAQSITQLLSLRIRKQVSRCWSPPVALKNAHLLIIKLRIKLNQNGTLSGPPKNMETTFITSNDSRIAQEAAIRAVISCAPYKNLPQNQYHQWKDIVLTFDPGKMILN